MPSPPVPQWKEKISVLTSGAYATLVLGPSRSVTNRVLWTLANGSDPGCLWVEFREPADLPGEVGPVELGWIPPTQTYVTRILEHGRPAPPANPSNLRFLLQVKHSKDIPRAFVDFFRLPELTRRLVAEALTRPRPRVIAFANAELVQEYYPQAPEAARVFISSLLEAGVHPMYALRLSDRPPARGSEALDFLFLADAKNVDQIAGGNLVCLRAPDGAPWAKGEKAPLESFASPVMR